eukprot:TRINITY_DN96022_c0_g1_i1.p1 TRINITY_DN96022_c0_g1~~TRINITY_DN96022_c0_g1_i1.p1  ORF type:complete len:203 (+),score=79.70 TRINITY_DN96022_c0_g1_i1:91-699(+)
MADLDISTKKGLGLFNRHLQDKSYVGGYVPTSDDSDVFAKFSEAPAKNFIHALRWYNHINSFSKEEQESWQAGENDNNNNNEPKKETPKAEEEEEDDDLDLFGSDDDDEFDEEYEKELEERAKAHLAKKAEKGKKVIDKSAVVFDVKPVDTEVDLGDLEAQVRAIEMDGLTWGEARTEDIAYGIQKIVIGLSSSMNLSVLMT